MRHKPKDKCVSSACDALRRAHMARFGQLWQLSAALPCAAGQQGLLASNSGYETHDYPRHSNITLRLSLRAQTRPPPPIAAMRPHLRLQDRCSSNAQLHIHHRGHSIPRDYSLSLTWRCQTSSSIPRSVVRAGSFECRCGERCGEARGRRAAPVGCADVRCGGNTRRKRRREG